MLHNKQTSNSECKEEDKDFDPQKLIDAEDDDNNCDDEADIDKLSEDSNVPMSDEEAEATDLEKIEN